MHTEIEAKWLNVNLENFRATLNAQGAKLINPERMMKRRTFDFADNSLAKKGGWVRVRDEGDKVTFSYKELNNRTLHGTKEVTVTVSDFEQTCQLLQVIGLEVKSYQETKRESWQIGAVEIELDTWPWVPSFVELESPNERLLKETAKNLGLQYADALHGSVEPVYQAVYNVTEDEINSWKDIRFNDVPQWLEVKRRRL